MFGAGGGTSSYREVEETDVVFLWGSNAREAHPIWFHHLLKGIRNGTRLYVMDPRRTASAQWADVWMGLRVGTDIALANTMAREIVHAGLAHAEFVANATTGFDAYRASVEHCTLEWGEAITGVPAHLIREAAHAFATAERAMVCWTLGITEHHNAVDNVLSLINLALLTGKVGRYACGLNPLRGQNNVQGGGDMGAIPNRLAGFQDILDPEVRAKFGKAWGVEIQPRYGWNLTQMFHAMDEGHMTGLYCIGENPAQSEADCQRTVRLLENLDCLVVQDMFLTKTAELADVVFPAAAAWCESEGTVTSSERRVQRVRKALEPPGEAREDIYILRDLAQRMGADWKASSAEEVWDELRSLSSWHAGMSYARLEQLGGIPWPCPDEESPGSQYLHGRLWADPVGGPLAPFQPVEYSPPVDQLNEEFPIRLTTGRRLDSFNTGVQTGGYSSPLRFGETIDLSAADAAQLGLQEGEHVRVVSRRGCVIAPVRVDPGLKAGLAFMTFHFPDQVATNVLTIDATDPKSGTAEFKAAAIRVEKLVAADIDAGELAGVGEGAGPTFRSGVPEGRS